MKLFFLRTRIEVLKAMVMKSFFFCDIMACSSLEFNRRLRGTCQRISQTINKREIRWQTEFLLGLYFDPEVRGEIFLRNVSWLPADYTTIYRRR
jgi:hypothetical protein